MNLFPAQLADTDSGLSLRLGEQRLSLLLPDALLASWRAWLGDSLTAGIRPEHLDLADTDAAGLSATVVDAEYLGHETLLHTRIDGMTAPAPTLIARLTGIRPFAKGSRFGWRWQRISCTCSALTAGYEPTLPPT